MLPLSLPLPDTRFKLDSAAVAGFFGGDEAIEAMATVHLYEGRRWLGWFNSPGSYTIAKRFGRMANSRLWDGLFPGPNDSPAVSFGLDGKKGPEYIATLSGTHMKSTGHLAYLAMKKEEQVKRVINIMGKRQTKPYNIAYLAMKHVDYETPVQRLPLRDAIFGLIPIMVSIVTCIMCAIVYDWFCFSMILLGIICGGWASVVIGKGRIVIKSVSKPSSGAPPGHGILVGEDDIMVVKGEERDVNAVTKGRFELEMDSQQGDEEKNAKRCYHAIGGCSMLLLLQFLVQLLLIPQGHLFGQIMFIISLVASWVYNSYLSSLEKERIQTDLLFQKLGNPEIRRFRVSTRVSMTVFVCLLLFHGVNQDSSEEEERARRTMILHMCIPNNTLVWKRWRRKVVDQLLHLDYQHQELPYLCHQKELTLSWMDLEPSDHYAPPSGYDVQLTEKNRELLNDLLDDASAAFKGYFQVCESLPVDSTHTTKRG